MPGEKIRGRAVKYIHEAEAHGNKIPERIDEFLRDMAKSHLLDGDPEGDANAVERKKDLKHWKVCTQANGAGLVAKNPDFTTSIVCSGKSAPSP
jgi:hypothetical protein